MTPIRPDLPGAALVSEGLADLECGDVETIAALLVSIGASRLRSLGLVVPTGVTEPEMALYLALARQHDNAAHSRYNGLVRRLVQFERALACVA